MTEDCDEMHLLVQADLDGELAASESARVAAHLARCPACAAVQHELLTLSARIRADAPRYPLPPSLRARLAPRRAWPMSAVGLALAACLALFLLLPRGPDLAADVVSAHIRALQPGHLMDVVSTDQHTVKPWFDGRLPFAPPVKDLAAQGFPLVGGRVDFLAGRTAAVLVYRRGGHVIDLFTWPSRGGVSASGSDDGYGFVRWSQDGADFWAVSDLNANDLADFVQRWKAT